MWLNSKSLLQDASFHFKVLDNVVGQHLKPFMCWALNLPWQTLNAIEKSQVRTATSTANLRGAMPLQVQQMIPFVGHPLCADGHPGCLPWSKGRAGTWCQTEAQACIFLSLFHSCAPTTRPAPPVVVEAGCARVHRQGAWPCAVFGWWLCVFSVGMQETLA